MKFYKLFKYLFILTPLGWFSPALAAGLSSDTYQTLAPITGYIATNVGTNSLTTYLNGMFKLGVAVATGLAVIMIVIGGIQYMSTDAIGGKEEGKEKITGALWGLLIALCAYILLNTINPALLNTDLKVQTAEGDVKNTPKQIGGLDPNAFVRPPTNDLSGLGGPAGFMGSGISQGSDFSDPGLYTSYNGSPIRDFYQDDYGNMIFDYEDGSHVVQYWNDTSPTGQGEYYNGDGYRIINGRTVSYVDSTVLTPDGVSNPIYHFEDGTYFIQYVDENNTPVVGGEYYDENDNRVINGRASDYQYYNSNAEFVVHYADCTGNNCETSYQVGFENTSSFGNGPLNGFISHGPYGVVDHSPNGGVPGLLDPHIAYGEQKVVADFPGSQVISDFRSPEWNEHNGGAEDSMHMAHVNQNGQNVANAFDVVPSNNTQGNAIVNWAMSEASTVGYSTIIWQGTAYISSNGFQTYSTQSASDHYDHVHIDRRPRG